MLFFLFRKSYIFWLFLFSKKFIISHKKSRKTNNLNSENKLFSAKSQKNKHYLRTPKIRVLGLKLENLYLHPLNHSIYLFYLYIHLKTLILLTHLFKKF